MARPQAFNTEDALNKAMEVFWNKGYEGTTLVNLLKATKLSKSSLYATGVSEINRSESSNPFIDKLFRSYLL